MILIYTTGVFDLLHVGHLNILRRASALGDKLIVGVQTDESVLKQKGELPQYNCEDRMEIVRSIEFVDAVIPYSDVGQRGVLETIKPDIMVQGDDWPSSSNRGSILKYLKSNKIRLVLFPYTNNVSTTTIKKNLRLKKNGQKKN